MCCFAQSNNKSKINILPLPVIGTSPETSWQIGVVSQLILSLHEQARSSVIKLEGKYTGLDQYLYEVEWDYYFNKEKWVTRGALYYYDFTEYYYGIGNNTPNSNEILFDFDRIQFRAMLLRKISDNYFFGLTYQYLDYNDIIPRTSETNFPELVDGNVNSYGFSIQRDTRKNVLNPKRASYLESSWNYNFYQPENYHKFILDYRRYLPVLGDNVLALRSLNIFNTDGAPYFDMAQVGGDEQVRGYLLGRFRNKNMMTVQSELRYFFDTFKVPIKFWFLDNPDFGLGFSVFAGLSNAFLEIKDVTNRILTNFGAGLKFLIIKENDIYIRFDYGVGVDGQSGIYLKFGEAF